MLSFALGPLSTPSAEKYSKCESSGRACRQNVTTDSPNNACKTPGFAVPSGHGNTARATKSRANPNAIQGVDYEYWQRKQRAGATTDLLVLRFIIHSLRDQGQRIFLFITDLREPSSWRSGLLGQPGPSHRHRLGRADRPLARPLVRQNTVETGPATPFMYAALFILPASFYALFNPLLDVRGEDAFWYVFVLAILTARAPRCSRYPCTHCA